MQERTAVLDLDYHRANGYYDDYDTSLESEWTNPSKLVPISHVNHCLSFRKDRFPDRNDFSWETIQKNRNLYYQKQTAERIRYQTSETASLLTLALNNHLNIGQNITMNTSSIFMSIETFPIESLANKRLEPIRNVQITLPSTFNTNFTSNRTVSLRVCFFSFVLNS